MSYVSLGGRTFFEKTFSFYFELKKLILRCTKAKENNDFKYKHTNWQKGTRQKAKCTANIFQEMWETFLELQPWDLVKKSNLKETKWLSST